MIGPRWLRHFIADWKRTFWIPCPHCGRMFGGFEWRDPKWNKKGHENTIPVPGDNNLSTAICPRCTKRGVGDEAWVPRYIAWQIAADIREYERRNRGDAS